MSETRSIEIDLEDLEFWKAVCKVLESVTTNKVTLSGFTFRSSAQLVVQPLLDFTVSTSYTIQIGPLVGEALLKLYRRFSSPGPWQPLVLRKPSKHGELLSIKEFNQRVRKYAVGPLGGRGFLACESGYDPTTDVFKDQLEEWVTHIMWFGLE